jgi:hypothetical protein
VCVFAPCARQHASLTGTLVLLVLLTGQCAPGTHPQTNTSPISIVPARQPTYPGVGASHSPTDPPPSGMPKSKRKSAEKTSTPSSTTAPAASAGKPSELQPVDVLEPASHPPGMGTGQSFGEIPGPSPMNGLSLPMQLGPPTPLRFENYSNNVERRLKRQSTGAAMCDVPVFLVGDHMAIVIPGYGSRGYLKTLGNAIALCKTRPYEMRGFKLAPGVGTDPGRSIYGYFGFYQDAKEAMEHAFDAHSNAKISKDVLVGPNDPFAKPPKVRP